MISSVVDASPARGSWSSSAADLPRVISGRFDGTGRLEMVSDSAFFDHKLLRTDSSGHYSSFSGSKRVRFTDDSVHLGRTQIHYAHITTLAASGSCLCVGYRTADGTVVEEYFRYDTFIQKRGVNKLQAAVSRALACKAAISPAVDEDACSLAGRQATIATATTASDGRTHVEIRDPRTLFPLVCPTC